MHGRHKVHLDSGVSVTVFRPFPVRKRGHLKCTLRPAMTAALWILGRAIRCIKDDSHGTSVDLFSAFVKARSTIRCIKRRLCATHGQVGVSSEARAPWSALDTWNNQAVSPSKSVRSTECRGMRRHAEPSSRHDSCYALESTERHKVH